ncbi:hypothetical protein EEL30_00990 (plasmid) [Brevibacillus laterosporus]|uniref:Phage ABA sandwich domain-containing protein n=1 Tax=Brevibacillus laterosporus TaxID=1465 RepID=A0A518V282_BRELA|nr:hypothetical protein EEL30_00990 [Brevibacillus laterosporus]
MSREIDAKVAELLGCEREEKQIGITVNGYIVGNTWHSSIPDFSTSCSEMLLLMEEARKQGLHFKITQYESSYMVIVGEKSGESFSLICSEKHTRLPTAVALAYLKAKGVDITLYLEDKK